MSETPLEGIAASIEQASAGEKATNGTILVPNALVTTWRDQLKQLTQGDPTLQGRLKETPRLISAVLKRKNEDPLKITPQLLQLWAADIRAADTGTAMAS